MDADALEQAMRDSIDGFSGRVSVAFQALAPGAQGARVMLDADATMPAASLIKLPVLACALQEVEEGRLDLARRVRVESGAHAGGDGVLRLLQGGLEPTVRDLLTLMIALSDNTATNLVLDLVGMEPVRAWIRQAGMARTRLAGKMQPTEATRTEAQRRGERNRTTATDVLGLLLSLERGDLLPPAARATMRDILAEQRHTQAIGRYLPLEPAAAGPEGRVVRLRSKHGSLPGTWHDAALVAEADERPTFALVVLSDEADDRAEHPEQEGLMLIAELARLAFEATPAPA